MYARTIYTFVRSVDLHFSWVSVEFSRAHGYGQSVDLQFPVPSVEDIVFWVSTLLLLKFRIPVCYPMVWRIFM